jgi:hypothetical protein
LELGRVPVRIAIDKTVSPKVKLSMNHRRARPASPPFKFSDVSFPHLLCRTAKAAATLAALLVFAPTAFTQTNFFPVLECKNRIYTNATIDTVSPATVTIFWDGGGERIPITNLPPELLARYHYDPQAAQKYLDAQGAKKAAQQERANQEHAAIVRAQNTLGPAQTIRIVNAFSDYHLQIEADGKVTSAYIHNLPLAILAAFREMNQTKAEAASLEAQIPPDQKVPAQPVPSTATGTRAQRAAARAQRNAATARATDADATAALAKVKAHLKELESRTTITACPTDYITGEGARQWEYQGMSTAGLTSK